MTHIKREGLNVLEVRAKDSLKHIKVLLKKTKFVKVLVKNPQDELVLHVPIFVVVLFSLFTPLFTAIWFFFCVIRGYTLEVYS